jgi:hypothetical protein
MKGEVYQIDMSIEDGKTLIENFPPDLFGVRRSEPEFAKFESENKLYLFIFEDEELTKPVIVEDGENKLAALVNKARLTKLRDLE